MKKKIPLLSKLIALVLTAALLAGCGGGAASAPAPDTGAPAETGSEAPVDAAANANREMVVGIPRIASSFDFFVQQPGYESQCLSAVYDSLVTKDADGKIAPMLAESYEISEDAMTYTFHLRKDVKFSDGSAFTAEDAKYSIDRLATGPYTDFCYVSMESCNIIDEYTVEMKLAKANVSILEYMANIYYGVVVSKAAMEKYGDEYGTSVDKVVGTGPYRVVEWKPAEIAKYEANEEYFMGAPSVKKVTIKTITDVNAAIIALQTGEIQAYFDDIPGISYDTLVTAEDVNVVDYASTILFATFLNNREGMFSDIRMRQAVAYAVDRNETMLVGCEGFGSVADYPGGRTSYEEGDPQLKDVWYKPDIEKAKQLVKEAGYEGADVVIKTYATDPYPKLATVLQDALTKAGLNASVQQMERSTLFEECLTQQNFDIMCIRWAAGTEDMDEIIYGSLHTDSLGPAGNWALYSNPDMDKYILDAQAETDPEQRKEYYKQVIEKFVEDAVYVPLYYPSGSRAYTKDLKIDDGFLRYDRLFYYNWAN